MTMLLCAKCGAKEKIPSHCGKPMKVVQTAGGKATLVCWMGSSCGSQDLPKHCQQVMGVSEEE